MLFCKGKLMPKPTRH